MAFICIYNNIYIYPQQYDYSFMHMYIYVYVVGFIMSYQIHGFVLNHHLFLGQKFGLQGRILFPRFHHSLPLLRE